MRQVLAPQTHKDDIITINAQSSDSIIIGDRMRKTDPKKVTELVESIRANGLLQPIIVRQASNGYLHLIAGAHRVEAMLQIWKGDDAINYPLTARRIIVAEKDEQIIEIAENLHRNDLTQAQRKRFAAMYGEMMESTGQSNQPAKKSQPANGRWFQEWREGANVAEKTAQNWWKRFKDATGETRTPSKAAGRADEFFAFLKQEADEAEQSKKDKEAADAEAEKEKQAAAYEKGIAAIKATISDFAADHGDKVWMDLMEWIDGL